MDREDLYLKEVNGVFQYYFRLAGKHFRRGRRTFNLSAAKLKAPRWYRDAQRKLDAGEEVECVSLTCLKRWYLENIKGPRKFAYLGPTIEHPGQSPL